MLEKKFRDLLFSFLNGKVSPLEVSWIAEDLRDRRDRRDLFSEIVEEFLNEFSGQVDATSEQRLRELLARDLSSINDRDLERAMPRKGGAEIASDVSDAGVDPAEEGIAEEIKSSGFRRTEEIVFEKPTIAPEERSWVLPVLGILVIIGAFYFMVRFSSLDRDRENAQEEAVDQRDVSDAALFFETDEYLSGVQASSDDMLLSLEDQEGDGEATTPGVGGFSLSLENLIRNDSSGSSDSTVEVQKESTEKSMLLIREP